MPTPCFWTEQTDRVAIFLRIYDERKPEERTPCGRIESGHTWDYHDGSVRVEDREARFNDEGYYEIIRPEEFQLDERWPSICACGASLEGMRRQVNQRRIYRSQNGQEWPQDHLPAGAMYDSDWNRKSWQPFATDITDPDKSKIYIDRGDGICLTVVLPNHAGEFLVDRRSVQGGFWDRTGDPRNPQSVTVSPSILHIGSYHGFLQAGVLTDDLDNNPVRT